MAHLGEEMVGMIERTLSSGFAPNYETVLLALPQTNNLKVGDDAPDGELFDTQGTPFKLHNFFNNEKKLVVLNFGSYT